MPSAPAGLSPNADPITREFFDFYQTPRGQYAPSKYRIFN
jgi:hypothetical protein